MPGSAFIQEEGFEKSIALDRKQILRLQIIVFMAKDIIGMKDKGMERTALFIMSVDTVHNILINDESLSRFDQVSGVVCGNLCDTLIYNQNLHFLVPVPANPAHVGFAKIQTTGVDRVIQRSVILFCI